MSKKEFLKALKKELKGLKSSEIQKNVGYYEELISDMTENGMTEEEAVGRIGTPENAAREILDAAGTEQLCKKDPVLAVLTILSILLVSASLYSLRAIGTGMFLLRRFSFSLTEDSAVSVIGGADGPTSIFVAGRISPPLPLYLATAAVLAATVIWLIRKRRK